ncbi:hypothetical protein [Kurthia huakuii]|uniref:hypothetical protein n=1 Tax=Kurthia huakuii TaxID=1421019 RepID=UPI000497C18E|nr:hypothetical protein [Kurthia huakuii]MBM7699644.1 putative effector of murein hydrolase LrgA (UPF0299 family) [Kurthia huakuii]
MKNKKFLNSLGLIMVIIFGGNFVVNYFRYDKVVIPELIGGIIGIVLLLIGGVVIKSGAPKK